MDRFSQGFVATIAALIVLAWTAAVISPELENGFVWEDHLVRPANQFESASEAIPELLFRDSHVGIAVTRPTEDVINQELLKIYRPLTHFSYWYDQHRGGNVPFGYHVTNFAGHLLVVGLLFLYLYRFSFLQSRVWVVAALSLYFGLHPVLPPVHAYITGRASIFSAIAMLAMLFTLRLAGHSNTKPAKWAWLVVTSALLFMGCLARETTLLGLPAILLFAYGLPARDNLKSWMQRLLLPTLILGTTSIAYLYLRQTALDSVSGIGPPGMLVPSLLRLPHFLMEGIQAFLIPQITSVRSMFEEYQQVSHWEVGIASVLFVGLVLATLRYRRNIPELGIGLLGFCFTLGPAVVTTNFADWRGFNRFLYTPFLLLLLGLGATLSRAQDWTWLRKFRQPRIFAVLITIYLLIFSVITYRAVADWHSDTTLWSASTLEQPNRCVGYLALGQIYAGDGRDTLALQAFQAATQRCPRIAKPWRGLVELHWKAGNHQACIDSAQSALSHLPEHIRFQYLLSNCAYGLDNTASVDAALVVLARAPYRTKIHRHIGRMVTSNTEVVTPMFRARITRPEYRHLEPLLNDIITTVESGQPITEAAFDHYFRPARRQR